jgi:DnaK suppressor protein
MNGLDYHQLRLVEEALDRLDSGDYGTCLACDEPIAEKRLIALPWARYCVKCEEEMGRGVMAGGAWAPPHGTLP